jgi:hypothetical protein
LSIPTRDEASQAPKSTNGSPEEDKIESPKRSSKARTRRLAAKKARPPAAANARVGGKKSDEANDAPVGERCRRRVYHPCRRAPDPGGRGEGGGG